MRPLLRLISLWLLYVAVFLLAKPLTMAANMAVYAPYGAADWWAVAWHGLKLDLAVGAYLSAVPALLTIAACWAGWRRGLRVTARVWLAIAALAATLTVELNAVLYGYWHFPLDTTPFHYFISAPASALASATTAQMLLAPLLWLASAALLAWASMAVFVPRRPAPPSSAARNVLCTAATLLLMALMFLAVRGGFTVSTLNPGAVYFSQHQPLNHAAVNPAFSLLHSATRRADYAAMARFYPDAEARRIVERFRAPLPGVTDSISASILADKRPDIWVVILESFSASLLPSLGGEDIARRLDSIAASGISASQCYAVGTRTDRGLTAILSALPSPPEASMMRFPALTEERPSIASMLRGEGYECLYYYGGDADFTNMRGYLLGSGFGRVLSDTDFPPALRTGKWGVADGPLLQRVLAEEAPALASATPTRRLRVVQTSSSHEPFDVPASFARYAAMPPAVKAFAYTDSVVGAFVDALRRSPSWSHTLVVLVADHWGCYPQWLPDAGRHHIPLVVVGGALAGSPRTLDVPASQADIAPSLAAWMGLDPGIFPYGRPLTDASRAPRALWFDKDRSGQLSLAADGSTVLSLLDNATALPAPESSGAPADTAEAAALLKATLQTLYTDIANHRK